MKIPDDTVIVIGPVLNNTMNHLQIAEMVLRHRDRARRAGEGVSFTTRTRVIDGSHLRSIFTVTKRAQPGDPSEFMTVSAFADEWERLTGEPVPEFREPEVN